MGKFVRGKITGAGGRNSNGMLSRPITVFRAPLKLGAVAS